MASPATPADRLKAIRQGIADALATITGFATFPYIMSNPSAPCAMVYSGDTSFDKSAGRGTDQRDMVVRVIVPFTNDIASQVLLDEFRAGAGPRSFKAAIEADTTLGGAAQTLRVTGITPDTAFRGLQGAVIGIGCEFQIELYAAGT